MTVSVKQEARIYWYNFVLKNAGDKDDGWMKRRKKKRLKLAENR